jgi:hypothetical protein
VAAVTGDGTYQLGVKHHHLYTIVQLLVFDLVSMEGLMPQHCCWNFAGRRERARLRGNGKREREGKRWGKRERRRRIPYP